MPNTSIPARDNGTKNVQVMSATITYLDNGTAKTIGTVPANAVIINAGVVVKTAFNAGTSNVLDIGTSGDDDGFATDIALGTIGRIVADEFATTNDITPSSDTAITATVALSGTAATAGEGIVWVEYITIG